MYKLKEGGVIRLEDNLVIPADDLNRHWAEYKEWLKAGNTPVPQTQEEAEANPAAVMGRLQRDIELARADIQLLKVQDGATGLGTQKAWRAYRNELRDWPSSKSFPDTMPIAPDAGV